MHMRLRDTHRAGKSSLRQLAISNLTPDVRQQLELRVLESQNGSPRISV